MEKKRATSSQEPRLNLPRVGIFHEKEIKATSIPFRRGKPSTQTLADEVAARDDSGCFLCHAKLTDERGSPIKDTKEDVFPQWMQRHFKLADKLIWLDDGTSRRYDEVLIPCCARCNNEYLSRFEDRIVTAFRAGFDRFSKLRKADVVLWCAKIYYALVHLQVKPRDPKTKQAMRPSLSRESLDDLRFLRTFLQGIRKRVIISGYDHLPFSLLIFPLHSGRDPLQYFEVKQVTVFPGLALQLGSIGIISIFDDFGEMELYYDKVFGKALSGKTLHPDQFWELAGRIFYRAYLIPVETSMSIVEGKEDMTLILRPRPIEGGPAKGDPWDLALWIARLTNANPEFFCNPKTKVQSTTLMRPDGSFNELKFQDASASP